MAPAAAGPATRGLDQACLRAATALGLLALALTLLAILLEVEFTVATLAAWLGAVVVWSAAFAIRAAAGRAAVQSLVLLALALLPIALPGLGPSPWVPVPLLAICASAIAALTLPLLASLPIAAAALLVMVASVAAGAGHFITAFTQRVPWLSLPFIACIGVGLSIARHAAHRITEAADAAAQQTDEATVLARRAGRAAQARAAVDRRIHETVLNTLAAVANGGASTERLRRECRRDLEQMQLGFMPQVEPGLADIVRSAMQVAGTMRAVLSVDVLRDVDLDRGPAGALRDALVECLRNVERHADAGRVHIVADADAVHARVTVTDDGIGMASDVQERFGVRNSIRANLAGMGGGATVASQPGEGTTVQLVAPLRLRPPALPPRFVVPRADRFMARAGLLGTVVAAVITMPFVSAGIALRPVLIGAMLAFAGSCLALAWPFRDAILRWLSRATLAVGVILLLLSSTAVTGCGSSAAVACVIVAVVGSLFVVLVDVGRGVAARLSALGVVLAASLLVILALPATCRGGVVLVLALITAFVVGLMAIILRALASLAAQERARRVAEEERRESDIEIAEVLASRAAWGKVTGTTREVLAAIADGTVDPHDAFVRDRARIEEAQLRARLDQREGSGLWQAVVAAAEDAALAGRSVDLNTIGSGREPRRAPAIVEATMRALLLDAPSGSVSARGMFIDGREEVLVTAPRELVARHLVGLADPSVLAEVVPAADAQVSQLILRWRTPTPS